jgi:hypothetical protein
VIHARKPHFNVSPAIFTLTLVKDRFHLEVIVVVFVWLSGGRKPLVVSAF